MLKVVNDLFSAKCYDIGLQWTFKFMDPLTMKSMKIIFKEKLFETRVDLEKQLKSNFFLGN